MINRNLKKTHKKLVASKINLNLIVQKIKKTKINPKKINLKKRHTKLGANIYLQKKTKINKTTKKTKLVITKLNLPKNINQKKKNTRCLYRTINLQEEIKINYKKKCMMVHKCLILLSKCKIN